ncbi:hypothetical protein KIMH_00020 [Bombiscardovia apis]|uniref:Uncharacterized protein n=1 Tax=Bombiscardovia apis TaxID=2932182 RepID=A0ABN6SCR7_9BIFI|nr:hypothetical protein KIMH_00020 [Bombiscardovia apis]
MKRKVWISVDILISYPLWISRILIVHKKCDPIPILRTGYPRNFSGYAQGLPTSVNKSVDNFLSFYPHIGVSLN